MYVLLVHVAYNSNYKFPRHFRATQDPKEPKEITWKLLPKVCGCRHSISSSFLVFDNVDLIVLGSTFLHEAEYFQLLS